MINKKVNTKHQAPTEMLLVVVGPTASGKTALGIELAKRLGGEIICADSRTVYKKLDIGTAKPTATEQQAVRHHLLDVVEPEEGFTVVDFKRLAEEAIEDIRSRGKVPIMVGGSGLYVDAVLYDYKFAPVGAPRSEVNPRHLSETSSRQKSKLRGDAVVFGITATMDEIKKRIEARVDVMVDEGFENEVRLLRREYAGCKALDAPGYKAFAEYLDGQIDIAEAKARFVNNDYQLAKRQMTWFRRNKEINWLNNNESYADEVIKILNK